MIGFWVSAVGRRVAALSFVRFKRSLIMELLFNSLFGRSLTAQVSRMSFHKSDFLYTEAGLFFRASLRSFWVSRYNICICYIVNSPNCQIDCVYPVIAGCYGVLTGLTIYANVIYTYITLAGLTYERMCILRNDN